MSFLAFVGQLVGIAREAQSTNLWGLACPFHCGTSSLPSLFLAFLLGLVLGISITALACFWILHCPLASPASSPPIVIAARSAAYRAQRRLEGYRPSTHE